MQSSRETRMQSELIDGESYTYYPLGDYVVIAPEVCGGEPTFKYTRINVRMILGALRAGWTIDALVEDYESPHLTADAIREAMRLANDAFVHQTQRQLALVTA